MDKPLAFNLFIYIKKQALILISSILLLSSSVQAIQKVDIYTYDSLPPFSFRDENNNLTGIYIEAVKKLLKGCQTTTSVLRLYLGAEPKH